MIAWYWVVLACFCSAFVGFATMALMAVAGNADYRATEMETYDAGFSQGHRVGYTEGTHDAIRAQRNAAEAA